MQTLNGLLIDHSEIISEKQIHYKCHPRQYKIISVKRGQICDEYHMTKYLINYLSKSDVSMYSKNCIKYNSKGLTK